MLNRFQQSLDRYLTSNPFDDECVSWCEDVIEAFSDDFYNDNEDWIDDNSGVFNKWLNRLHHHSPTKTARIIERGHSIYLKKKDENL
jgi:hypothetical protein